MVGAARLGRGLSAGALAGPWENLTVLPTLGVPVLGPVLLLVAVVLELRARPGEALARLRSRPLPAGAAGPGGAQPRRDPGAVDVPLPLQPPVRRRDRLRAGGSGPRPACADADPPLRMGSDVVRNIYAYDSVGQPLQGVNSSTRRADPSPSPRPRAWGSAPTARSPARGSTARRRSSTSFPCRSAPSATAPASARSTPQRWVCRASTNPRWPRCRRRRCPPDPRGGSFTEFT